MSSRTPRAPEQAGRAPLIKLNGLAVGPSRAGPDFQRRNDADRIDRNGHDGGSAARGLSYQSPPPVFPTLHESEDSGGFDEDDDLGITVEDKEQLAYRSNVQDNGGDLTAVLQTPLAHRQQQGQRFSLASGKKARRVSPTPMNHDMRSNASTNAGGAFFTAPIEDKIIVGVRVRPLIPSEFAKTSQVSWTLDTANHTISSERVDWNKLTDEEMQRVPDDRRSSFTFAQVFSPDTSNAVVYEEQVLPLVEHVVEGYNGTVMAYGQTTSGKTHTITGGDNGEKGVLQLSLEDLFQFIDQKGFGSTFRFAIKVSYCEIYQEVIHDLIEPSNHHLGIVDDPLWGPVVKGLSRVSVSSQAEALKCLHRGLANRHVGKTGISMQSSRSHTIFSVRVESKPLVDEASMNLAAAEDIEVGGGSSEHVLHPLPPSSQSNIYNHSSRQAQGEAAIAQDAQAALRRWADDTDKPLAVSSLNIIDLAGSERVSKTKARGWQLKEAGSINKSLAALGNVISAINGELAHVPFRDSKLTRLLSAALGGNSNTSMICCISPALLHHDESRSTLQFAHRASNIRTLARVNKVETGNAILNMFKTQVSELQRKLALNVSEKQGLQSRVDELQQRLSYALSNTLQTPRFAKKEKRNDLDSGNGLLGTPDTLQKPPRSNDAPSSLVAPRGGQRTRSKLNTSVTFARNLGDRRDSSENEGLVDHVALTPTPPTANKSMQTGPDQATAAREEFVAALHKQLAERGHQLAERDEKLALAKQHVSRAEQSLRHFLDEGKLSKQVERRERAKRLMLQNLMPFLTQKRELINRLDKQANDLAKSQDATRLYSEEVKRCQASLIQVAGAHKSELKGSKKRWQEAKQAAVEANMAAANASKAAADARRDAADARRDAADARKALGDATAENQLLVTDNGRLTANQEQMLADTKRLTADKERLTTEKDRLASASKRLAAGNESLGIECEALQKRLARSEKEQVRSAAKVRNVLEEAAAARADATAVREVRDALERRVGSSNSLETAMQHCRDFQARLDTDVAAFRVERNAFAEERKLFKEHKRKIDAAQVLELDRAKQDLQQARADLVVVKQELAETKREAAVSLNAAEERARNNARVQAEAHTKREEQSPKALQAMEAELKRTKNKLEAAEQQNVKHKQESEKNLQRADETLRAMDTELQRVQAQAKEDAQEAMRKVEETRAELGEARAESDRRHHALKELKRLQAKAEQELEQEKQMRAQYLIDNEQQVERLQAEKNEHVRSARADAVSTRQQLAQTQAEMEQQLEQLQTELEQQQDEAVTAKEQYHRAEKELRHLQETLEQQQGEFVAAKEQHDQAEQNLRRAQVEAEQQKDEASAAKQRHEHAAEEFHRAQSRVGQQHDEAVATRKQLERVEKELQRERVRAEQLHDEAAATKIEREQVNQGLLRAQADLQQIQSELASATERLAMAERTAAEMEQRAQFFKSAAETRLARVEALESDLHRTYVEQDSTSAALVAQKQIAEQATALAEALQVRLNTEIQELESAREHLESRVAELETRVASAEAGKLLAENEKAQAECEKAQAECEKVQAAREFASALATEKDSSAVALATEKQATESALEAMAAGKHSTSKTIEQLSVRIQVLESELEVAANSQSSEEDALREQLRFSFERMSVAETRLEQEANDMLAVEARHEHKCAAMTSDVERLSIQIEMSQAREAAQISENAGVAAALASTRDQLVASQVQLADKKDLLAAKQDELEKMREQVETKTEELANAQGEFAEKERSLSAAAELTVFRRAGALQRVAERRATQYCTFELAFMRLRLGAVASRAERFAEQMTRDADKAAQLNAEVVELREAYSRVRTEVEELKIARSTAQADAEAMISEGAWLRAVRDASEEDRRDAIAQRDAGDKARREAIIQLEKLTEEVAQAQVYQQQEPQQALSISDDAYSFVQWIRMTATAATTASNIDISGETIDNENPESSLSPHAAAQNAVQLLADAFCVARRDLTVAQANASAASKELEMTQLRCNTLEREVTESKGREMELDLSEMSSKSKTSSKGTATVGAIRAVRDQAEEIDQHYEQAHALQQMLRNKDVQLKLAVSLYEDTESDFRTLLDLVDDYNASNDTHAERLLHVQTNLELLLERQRVRKEHKARRKRYRKQQQQLSRASRSTVNTAA